MANEIVTVGGRQIMLQNPKRDLDIASRKGSGKYYKGSGIPTRDEVFAQSPLNVAGWTDKLKALDGGSVWLKSRKYDYADGRGFLVQNSAHNLLQGNPSSVRVYASDSNMNTAASRARINFENAPLVVPSTGLTSSEYMGFVFAKRKGFFTTVAWIGDGSGNRVIPHDLGVLPGHVIVTGMTSGGISSGGMNGWHIGNPVTEASPMSYGNLPGTAYGFQHAEPTSDKLYITDRVNTAGVLYYAEIFAAEQPGLIRCFNFELPASYAANSIEVNVGFRPSFMLFRKWKASNSSVGEAYIYSRAHHEVGWNSTFDSYLVPTYGGQSWPLISRWTERGFMPHSNYMVNARYMCLAIA